MLMSPNKRTISSSQQNINQWDVGVWTGLSWFMTGTVVGTCECGNEPLGSIKCRKFPDLLTTG